MNADAREPEAICAVNYCLNKVSTPGSLSAVRGPARSISPAPATYMP